MSSLTILFKTALKISGCEIRQEKQIKGTILKRKKQNPILRKHDHLCRKSNMCVCVCVCVCSVMSDSGTPWTIAFQAPLSMGFPRQEH